MSKMNTTQTMMFTSQQFEFIQSRTLGISRCAPLEQQVEQQGERCDQHGRSDERQSGHQSQVVLREVHAHRQHDDDV